MNAPVNYIPLMPSFPSKGFADLYGRGIDREVKWVRRDNAPRQEAFYCKYPASYFYGNVGYGRSYDADTDIPPLLKELWDVLELGGTEYEACFLNKYEHANEHLGWHADKAKEGVTEGIDHTRPIAVISFGAERELWFRENGTSGADSIEKLLLESGSLCLMLPGMQHTHQHRIPKAGREVGTRVSLTFRGLLR